MEDMTQTEIEARIEHLMSLAEDMEAEHTGRLEALQDYIDDEEAELDDMASEIAGFYAEAQMLRGQLD